MGWEDLRTQLISALSSSASCWLSLVQAASMAVMYSKLGGCLGDTTKLGPLARIDLWAGVKGLLDRLMAYFGLGSSEEDPWGSLMGGRRWVVFPETSAVCLGGCTIPLGCLGDPCLAEHLVDWLPDRVATWLPAWLEGGLVPAWEGPSLVGVLGVTMLPAWEEVPYPGRWETACFTACLPACLGS